MGFLAAKLLSSDCWVFNSKKQNKMAPDVKGRSGVGSERSKRARKQEPVLNFTFGCFSSWQPLQKQFVPVFLSRLQKIPKMSPSGGHDGASARAAGWNLHWPSFSSELVQMSSRLWADTTRLHLPDRQTDTPVHRETGRQTEAACCPSSARLVFQSTGESRVSCLDTGGIPVILSSAWRRWQRWGRSREELNPSLRSSSSNLNIFNQIQRLHGKNNTHPLSSQV